MALFFILEHAVMASQIDICNIALSHLGDSANITDLNEGSAQADHCRVFYPNARDVALEMGIWDFATRREVLALVADAPPSSWAYAYSLPAACLRALAVLDVNFDERNSQRFIIESLDDGTRVLYTDQVDATLRYTKKVTDTTQFTPLFVDAVGWLLASYLAGPVIKGQEGQAAGRAAYQTFIGQIANAASSNLNQQQNQQRHVPSSISARRGCGLPGDPGYFPYSGGNL